MRAGEAAGEALTLPADGYALIPYATAHAVRNRGTQSARWFEILAPQPKPQSALRDTFFTGGEVRPAIVGGAGTTPNGTRRFRAENPLPPMGGALQQGLSMFRFMERPFGAQCFFMTHNYVEWETLRTGR